MTEAQILAGIREGDSFDLGILDMQARPIGEMDSLTLAAEIRRYENSVRGECDVRSLPLVILNSVGQWKTDVEAENIAAYLSKPVNKIQLLERVRNLLRLRHLKSKSDDESAGRKKTS